jgi:YVTN family beta-propeller protein
VYSLGVDLGTTFVAAATARRGVTEMVSLGDRSVATPAVVFLREDDSLVTGDAAARRAEAHPERAAREVKRRVGSPTPVMVGGTAQAPTTLLAALLRDVLDKVTETEGRKPDRVVLTHPANWGPFRRNQFEEIPVLAGLEIPPTVTEPGAAAAYYSASHQLGEGETLAVYDLGGGTFDATVLRAHEDGVEILGTPEGIERLGGVDFDEAILAHVNYVSRGALDDVDLSDPQTTVAMARLRQDCVLAKEALSVDDETVVPVFLPGRHSFVELTRATFEDMIRAPIESTIGALAQTLRSAQVKPADLSAVLLIGGSSRIPLVAEMVSEGLGRPTLVDTHPKHAVALGAAALAERPTSLKGVKTTPHTAPTAAPPTLPRPVPKPFRGPEWEAPWQGSEGARPADSTERFSRPAETEEPFEAGKGGPGGESPRRPPMGGRGPGGPPPRRPRPAQAPGSGGSAGKMWSRAWFRGLVVAAIGILAVLILAVALAATVFRPTPSSSVGAPPVFLPPSPPQVTSVGVPAVVATWSVGNGPESVAVSPDGTRAYVTGTTANVLSVLDLASGATLATVAAPGPPQYATVTPDGSRVYVSIAGTSPPTNAIAVFDVARNVFTTLIPSEQQHPYALAASPDGERVYVPNHDSGGVSVIDTRTNTITADIPVAPMPHWVAFTPSGRFVYVANHMAGLVTVIDTQSNQVVATVSVGGSPHSIAVSPDGRLAEVVNYDGNYVSIIDTSTNAVVKTVPVGTNPQSIAFSTDGAHSYIVNNVSNNLSVLDNRTYAITATVPLSTSPHQVAVSRDGRRAFVTNQESNSLSVLSIAS